jgi:hypothetical protein
VESEFGPDTWPTSLTAALVSCLKTNPAREAAREIAKSFPKHYDQFLEAKRHFRRRESSVLFSSFNSFSSYQRTSTNNRAVDLYLQLSLVLDDPDTGIAYYYRHHKDHTKEITLYCLLTDFLSDDDAQELWLREYRSAIARGISPRANLVEEYQRRSAASS